MFVIDLHYTAPLAQLDAHMTEHVQFLTKYYKMNVFVASGRKVPRTGGIILAIGKTKAEIEVIMSEDSFYSKGLATITVTEFLTSQSHAELRPFIKKFA